MRTRLLVLAFLILTVAGCSQQAAIQSIPQKPNPTMVNSEVESTPGVMPAVEPAAEPTVDLDVLLALAPFLPTAIPTPETVQCRVEGRIVSSSVPSEIAGEPLDYRVYLPPCYGLDGHVYPTLYILAGNIHDESFWDSAGLDEAAEQLISELSLPPMLIVMPDGGYVANNTSGGPYSYEAMILEEVIPHVEESYCAWKSAKGRAIGGLSRGGYWALEIAFRNAGQFAGVGGHSASLLDYGAGPDLAPGTTALTNKLGNLKIYLDIGQNDYLRYELESLHEALEAAGIAHSWRLNEGEHVDAYWAEHAGEYLRWYGRLWPGDREQLPLCG